MFSFSRTLFNAGRKFGFSIPKTASSSFGRVRSFHLSAFRSTFNQGALGFRNISMNQSYAIKAGVAGLLGLGVAFAINTNQIHNDAAASAYELEGLPPPPKGYDYVKVPEKPKYNGAFGGKLNYKELTIGSVFGMVSGLIAGQLSSVFVFLALGAYLAVQYLHAQGILTIPITKVIRVGSEDIDVNKMIFEQPSFSITYLLSFLIAAYNA